MDRIGLLNLLPNVINTMEGPASVLYTSTQVEKVADETNLLEKLLCGDVSVMCALLGVVPSAYLCGHTFQAFEEYHDLRPLALDTLPTEASSIPFHLYTMFNERQKDDPNSDPTMVLIMMHFRFPPFPIQQALVCKSMARWSRRQIRPSACVLYHGIISRFQLP